MPGRASRVSAGILTIIPIFHGTVAELAATILLLPKGHIKAREAVGFSPACPKTPFMYTPKGRAHIVSRRCPYLPMTWDAQHVSAVEAFPPNPLQVGGYLRQTFTGYTSPVIEGQAITLLSCGLQGCCRWFISSPFSAHVSSPHLPSFILPFPQPGYILPCSSSTLITEKKSYPWKNDI